MKQTAAIISTYAADISGICSAMYELGGMTVMHDASGCNSTYNTHDEPRWYDMDSLVFISGLSEMDAMMGDDDKLIHDIVTAAEELQPRTTQVNFKLSFNAVEDKQYPASSVKPVFPPITLSK